MVEAIDRMLGDQLREEIAQFVEDRNQLAEMKAKYAVKMQNNATLMQEFVTRQLSKEVKESYFHFYDVSAELLKSIVEQQPNWNIRLRKRKAAIQVGNTEIQTIPEGYTVSSVLQIHPEQIERIPQNIFQSFYDQWEDFKTQSHAQIIWTEDGSFASMCYGAAFGSGLGEVDVFTDEKHRGKGLGECAVQHFIKSLQQEGKTAHWDCFLDNFGSLALAKKCGFEFNKEYWFLSIYKVT